MRSGSKQSATAIHYDPERDGRGGIRGGCSTCFALFDLYQARLSLDIAHREFLRRAIPWTNVRARQKEAQSLQDEKTET